MLKRREFIKHTALVAGAASTGLLGVDAEATVGSARLESRAAMRAIQFVVFDETIQESVAFACELEARGARLFAVRQDIGQLWFGELGAAFSAGQAIAGLTSHTELLVCKEFTRRHDARVRYEGLHDCRGSEFLTHSLRSLDVDFAAAGVAWPRTLAARLATVSNFDAMQETCCRTSVQRSASNPGSLFSWLIA